MVQALLWAVFNFTSKIMATVTGRLTDSSGSALASEPFEIVPVEFPDPQLRFSLKTRAETTAGDGTFSLTLVPGVYKLRHMHGNLRFRVNSSSGSYSISDIVESE